MVPGVRIELTTQGSSGLRSTTELSRQMGWPERIKEVPNRQDRLL